MVQADQRNAWPGPALWRLACSLALLPSLAAQHGWVAESPIRVTAEVLTIYWQAQASDHLSHISGAIALRVVNPNFLPGSHASGICVAW